MIFNKIHHIAIICSDYEKSKDFYVNILGFKIMNEVYREDRASYKLDLVINEYTQIELFSFPDTPERLSYPEACGLRHLAFNVKDLDEVVEYLKCKGIDVEDIRVNKYTLKRFTFFKDPDGLHLEIIEK